ncbi:MAG: S-layer homology domain-containing protein [Clostridia bacterium]|nr:S-layer homology domain-containing protein [Clostridia bacterium]
MFMYCYAGGIAGYLTASFNSGAVTQTISGCTNTGDVAALATEPSATARHNASAYAGGIVGCFYSINGSSALTLTISECENLDNINTNSRALYTYSQSKNLAGGIAGDVIIEGDADGTFVMTDSSNSGTIYVQSSAYYTDGKTGGLLGELVVNNDYANSAATIESCQNSAVVRASLTSALTSEPRTQSFVGGIAGYAYTSADYDSTLIFSDCVNSGEVESGSTGYSYARSSAGGIVGYGNAYTYESSASATGSLLIRGCANTTQISGTAQQLNTGISMSNTRSYSGGIAGYTSDAATIISCYNRGSVDASGSAYYYTGGICGYPNYGMDIYISSCYSTGAITSNIDNSDIDNTENAGGVVGYFTSGALTDCYWLDGSATAAIGMAGSSQVDESCTSKTAAELQSSDFVTTLSTAADAAAELYGVSDMPIWAQAASLSANDGYPVLTWPVPAVVTPIVISSGNSTNNISITNPDGTASVSGTLTQTADGRIVTVGGSGFAQVAGAGSGVTVNTGSEIVTFNNRAANYISDAAGTGNVVLTIEEVDPASLSSLLPDEELALIGDRPVYDFTLTANGTEISAFGGGSATITIPYTLLEGENPLFVVVYYIDASGNLQSVRGFYDEATGMVTFRTKHFSGYAVGYNAVSFSDVADDAWYCGAVSFISARGITEGVDATHFAPEMNLTRAQFLVILMRAYGFEPDDEATDNFADAGDTWYTGYLAEGKAQGLTSGVGDNLFAPDREITRQEMFTMLYNALNVMEELPSADGNSQLSDFEDAGDIADWAGDAMQTLVEGGIVSGSGANLFPTDTASRAQMAQVLLNILTK